MLDTAKFLPDEFTGEANSMIYEYLCVAIAGRLEQNIKQVLVLHANNKSDAKMGAAVSRLCQQFQNPDKEKILLLIELFDKDYSRRLRQDWSEEGSVGNTISDLVGLRKAIAHQTTNSRNATRTKVERFFQAYRKFIGDFGAHFLG
ncbi:hypothetical protein [uncultured Thioclava sp.]|uniref:hypothetical protein n=1 Tax=uncultured Thioclava sp. TaxID=473858 RepID=UPI0025D6E387|nr:hypothetical protein [uncultured Thioclava sp.]